MHLRYGPVMLREGHGERSSRTREQSSVSQMPTLAFICLTELINRVLYVAGNCCTSFRLVTAKTKTEIRLKHPH